MRDFEATIQDADIDQAELESAGRSSERGHRAMLRLRASGKLVEAAEACHHGWGYPTNSGAANGDPRYGETGMRCLHCGSWWRGDVKFWDLRRVPVTVPCELEPRS